MRLRLRPPRTREHLCAAWHSKVMRPGTGATTTSLKTDTREHPETPSLEIEPRRTRRARRKQSLRLLKVRRLRPQTPANTLEHPELFAFEVGGHRSEPDWHCRYSMIPPETPSNTPKHPKTPKNTLREKNGVSWEANVLRRMNSILTEMMSRTKGAGEA